MATLLRNDVLIRLRKTMDRASGLTETISNKYANGIIPCQEDIKKMELLIAYIEILSCYEPPISEILATGTFTLTGTTGSVRVHINGVPITDAAESFSSNLNTTATALAASITADTSSPNYTATSSSAVVTVIAATGSGDKVNRFRITTSNTGDMDIGTITHMNGGVLAREDDDNCMTEAVVLEVFSHISELLNLKFAPPATTYINPNDRFEQTEELTLITGGFLTAASVNLAVKIETK